MNEYYEYGYKLAKEKGDAGYDEFVEKFGVPDLNLTEDREHWSRYLEGVHSYQLEVKKEKLGPKLKEFLSEYDTLMAKFPEINISTGCGCCGQPCITIGDLSHDFSLPIRDDERL